MNITVLKRHTQLGLWRKLRWVGGKGVSKGTLSLLYNLVLIRLNSVLIRIYSWNLKGMDLVLKVVAKTSSGRSGIFWACILFRVI